MFGWDSLISLVQRISRQRAWVIDTITGLTHLKPFNLKLQKRINDRSPFYLIQLNIDNLKSIKQLNSKEHVKVLLRQFSQRIKLWLPPAGFVSRIDKDEFLICIPFHASDNLPDVNPNYWHEMQAMLSAPYFIRQKPCQVTINTGVTTYLGEVIALEQLLSRATFKYHENLNEQQRNRTRMEDYLRTALQQGELSLNYQPQYELENGTLRGFEALLRWNHPVLGSVPPCEFIPIAEETLLIIPIGQWVLRQACEAMQRILPDSASTTISVNISAIQLMDEQFADFVSIVLKQTGLSPARLELELTESTLISSMEVAEKQLKKLRALGIRLALDDFGIGYSSMSYLRKLPFHLIKIDKSFIHDIKVSGEQVVTGPMIHFIKQLRYVIVAEGIETYDQLVYLKKSQCDYGQGYLFSKPVPESDLLQLIQSTEESGVPSLI